MAAPWEDASIVAGSYNVGVQPRNKDLRLLSLPHLSVNLTHSAETPVDLFINAVITASSVVLFCYWFRYTCLLILAAETPHDYSEEVAEVNQLSFPEVRAKLRQHDGTDLDRLHNCLERDFAILSRLLEHTHHASFYPRFEEAMLTIHFRTMSSGFRLTRSHFRESAADALEEMSRVVTHLANQLGERSATAH